MSTRLRIRYGSYLVTALVAGFVVVVTQAFDPSTAGWIAFGAGVFFIATAAIQAIRMGIVHRLTNAGIEILGVLMVIESLIASGSSVQWLSFAGALAVLGLSVLGLTIHELSTERVVHSFELSSETTNAKQPVLS